ncbi:MAG TPA: TatD family hydrolase, partial [Gemmatimonadaceae bacterium]|nr:TatD family hydrolase [Gemmatimonadaceae bacterium]
PRHDARRHAGSPFRCGGSHSAVRLGNGVRYLYRNVQLDLYREPDATLDREEMAEESGNLQGYIDSHAHLADPAFDSDRGQVIERARQGGAEAIVCIGSGSGAGDVLGAARASRAIAAGSRGFIWFTVGVHPHDAIGFDPPRDIEAILAEARSGAVAIGECGLDYHYENSPRREQRVAFAEQLKIARDSRLPVVVHTRDAEEDTAAMISEAAHEGVIGVLHCYTGSHELAERALSGGWYVSFSGIVTFRKWIDDDLLRLVPDDRILAESDSPYLAPVPFRGKRNEPAWVSRTVARLADARAVDRSEMALIVARNARALFRLPERQLA